VGEFNGGTITSDAGALLLREINERCDFIKDFAKCFTDFRNPNKIEHSLHELLAQRIFGLCLGYEDLIDHDELRLDPLLAAACGKMEPEGNDRKSEQDKGKALAGKSTLNRLELACVLDEPDRYKKIFYSEEAIDNYFVDKFIESYSKPPGEIILDIDATDDPLHGQQQGRYFHGYYDCYCYLPLYIFCGDKLLSAKLNTANLDPGNEALVDITRVIRRIRSYWPLVKILVRGDSGFCREDLMAFCESEENVDYLFGISRNNRLLTRIKRELKQAEKLFHKERKPQRLFKDFCYRTKASWSRRRRVIGKAEYLAKGANPRFIVTSLPKDIFPGRQLYEATYCARGDMENRIKEQQLYLFADRTSCGKMAPNRLRLYLSSVAYIIMNELRSKALEGTPVQNAQCSTLRLKLLKIGALIKISVRRVHVSISSAYPYKDIFIRALSRIKTVYPLRC
jgi:hypothetical protein